jgi:hypothetical protein
MKVPSVVKHARWTPSNMEGFLTSNEQTASIDLPRIINNELLKYIDLPDKRAGIIITLWIIGTYLQPIWNIYPYLSISGVKRVGKSKLLKFLSMLSFNAIFSTSMSTAMLYRLIESLSCTMLLDESEKYSVSEKQQEIRNILNSGYKRGSKVHRAGKTKKGQIIPEEFEPFSPKAIVTYKGLEGVTEDRSIPVVLLRSRNRQVVNHDIQDNETFWQNTRNLLYCFAMEHWLEIEEIYQTHEVEVNHPDYMSRERELWKPILALAEYFNLTNKLVPYIIEVINERKELECSAPEYKLLEALQRLVTETRMYTNAEIRGAIVETSESGSVPDYVTPHWLGCTLSKQFKLRSTKRNNIRGYILSPTKIKSLCLLYDVDLVEQPKTYAGGSNEQSSESTLLPKCTNVHNVQKP